MELQKARFFQKVRILFKKRRNLWQINVIPEKTSPQNNANDVTETTVPTTPIFGIEKTTILLNRTSAVTERTITTNGTTAKSLEWKPEFSVIDEDKIDDITTEINEESANETLKESDESLEESTEINKVTTKNLVTVTSNSTKPKSSTIIGVTEKLRLTTATEKSTSINETESVTMVYLMEENANKTMENKTHDAIKNQETFFATSSERNINGSAIISRNGTTTEKPLDYLTTNYDSLSSNSTGNLHLYAH